MSAPAKPLRRLNVNVGVLGHVDSGKTSLVAALSTRLSTAALDKHPQSKERGITLDLGFSAFTAPMPAQLAGQPYEELQVTLVDCPGHASLIRTVIGGAQIIDMMLLVVDVTKGIQAQTAECLVVGEVATQHMVVVLNKVDLLPLDGRQKLLARARKRLAATFAQTKFAGCPMVAVAAKPGGGDGVSAAKSEGVEELIAELLHRIPPRLRRPAGPLLFAIDHCFAIRGQGTVLTGTVLRGGMKVGDTVELPALKLQRKVRSLQMFSTPVQAAAAGDRAAMAVTQLEAGQVERGLAAAPGSVPTFSAAVAAIEKIRFFAGEVRSKARMHVSVGHTTIMADLDFFSLPAADHEQPSQPDALAAALQRLDQLTLQDSAPAFDFSQQYLYQEQLYGLEGRPHAVMQPKGSGGTASNGAAGEAEVSPFHGPQWALLRFSQPVTAPADALVIGSKLDADASAAACRLAFCGRLAAPLNPDDPKALAALQVFKTKQRAGSVERMGRDARHAVCRGMFKKETDLSAFTGMQVSTANGVTGVLEGAFGKSGKFNVSFSGDVQPGEAITLRFKKLVYKRLMVQ